MAHLIHHPNKLSVPSMSYHHINITQLTNIESNYYLDINARECARRMNIGKDKVYTY